MNIMPMTMNIFRREEKRGVYAFDWLDEFGTISCLLFFEALSDVHSLPASERGDMVMPSCGDVDLLFPVRLGVKPVSVRH